MPNILLTGATGFIGSNILKAIKLNNKVFVLQRLNSKIIINKSKNIKILKFKDYNSLSNKLKKIKVNTIIHCATHYKKKLYLNGLKKQLWENALNIGYKRSFRYKAAVETIEFFLL